MTDLAVIQLSIFTSGLWPLTRRTLTSLVHPVAMNNFVQPSGTSISMLVLTVRKRYKGDNADISVPGYRLAPVSAISGMLMLMPQTVEHPVMITVLLSPKVLMPLMLSRYQRGYV